MTHDELVKKILSKLETEMSNNTWGAYASGDSSLSRALFRVVELHKPIEEDGKLFCSQELCYNHIEFLERDKCDCSYPCPTIQAIEKELR